MSSKQGSAQTLFACSSKLHVNGSYYFCFFMGEYPLFFSFPIFFLIYESMTILEIKSANTIVNATLKEYEHAINVSTSASL